MIFGFDARLVVLGGYYMKRGRRRCECTTGRLDIADVIVQTKTLFDRLQCTKRAYADRCKTLGHFERENNVKTWCCADFAGIQDCHRTRLKSFDFVVINATLKWYPQPDAHGQTSLVLETCGGIALLCGAQLSRIAQAHIKLLNPLLFAPSLLHYRRLIDFTQHF